MDNPSIEPAEHQRALAGLRRINWICRTGHYVAQEIEAIARSRRLDAISVLDMGCGSGDVAISVTKSLSKKICCRTEGWDVSQTACNAATANASRQSWLSENLNKTSAHSRNSSVSFQQVNVFEPPEVQFDFVYCCLFLHHFSESQAVEVLQNMKRIAKVAVIVDDLLRTHVGLFLAKLGCYGLSRSPVVHFDGPQSVRAAFSKKEVRQLASQAQLHNAVAKQHWPQRYLLSWESKE
ncbi:MAG: methyltransferase domain-containing protein [Planctomycetota bacterium]|nr:methyltransferase domain-containing protein [Planctomycetota bacterium]